jgi:NAD(P)-dependent dehydrogenase (short-subunit alcohol dehydrogenase family)
MKKTVLITGGTGAIGRATALEIAKTGATTVILARNRSKLESVKNEISLSSGNDGIDILCADFSDISAVKNATDEFKQKYERLDALINVAGIYKNSREISTDRLELMFAVNHLAPFILTTRLLDLLNASKPARVITISAPSVTKIQFDDLQGEKKYSALAAFGASKMMNLMFTYALARRLEGHDVSSSAFHPGLVKSDLTREMPALLRSLTRLMSGKPDKAAKILCRLAVYGDPADMNGKFYKFSGSEIKSSPYSYDKQLQEKLWAISQELSA